MLNLVSVVLVGEGANKTAFRLNYCSLSLSTTYEKHDKLPFLKQISYLYFFLRKNKKTHLRLKPSKKTPWWRLTVVHLRYSSFLHTLTTSFCHSNFLPSPPTPLSLSLQPQPQAPFHLPFRHSLSISVRVTQSLSLTRTRLLTALRSISSRAFLPSAIGSNENSLHRSPTELFNSDYYLKQLIDSSLAPLHSSQSSIFHCDNYK